MPRFSGKSKAATGTINNGSASLLSFLDAKATVVIGNRSGQPAFFTINDVAESQTVSNTVHDFFLEDKQQFIIEDAEVVTLGVYVAATSGVRAVGWD